MTGQLPHLTTAVVVQDRDRFLLVEERIGGQLLLNQPAGHVEAHETLPEAAVRETLEETGWLVEPTAIVGIYRWQYDFASIAYLRVCFAARCRSYVNEQILDPVIVRTLWLDYNKLKRAQNLRSPMVLRCVEDYMSGSRYPLTLYKDVVLDHGS